MGLKLENNFDYEQTLFCEHVRNSSIRRNLFYLKILRCLGVLGEREGVKKVVDLGCGIGTASAHIDSAFPGIEVVGVDLSRSALLIASEQNSRLSFVRAEVTDLPFRGGSIDFVCGFDIVEHLRDVERFFEEVARVVSRGGRMHFHIPCEGEDGTLWWLLSKTGRLGNLKKEYGGHIQRFTQKEVKSLIRGAGFEIVKINYSYHLFGQILDVIQWLSASIRMRSRIGNTDSPDSEISSFQKRGWGWELVLRFYGVFTHCLEIISYCESKFLARLPVAMAIDVTAVKGTNEG